MANVLDLELNVQPMVTAAAQADRALDQVTKSATSMAQRVDLSSRQLSSFGINTLQAVNNVVGLGNGFRNLVQGSASLSQNISAMSVDVGLLAGNFLHLYNATQQAGGPTGLAGVFASLRTGQGIFVLITAALTLAAQGIALFASNTEKAATAMERLKAASPTAATLRELGLRRGGDVEFERFKINARTGGGDFGPAAQRILEDERIRSVEEYSRKLLEARAAGSTETVSSYDLNRVLGYEQPLGTTALNAKRLSLTEALGASSYRLGGLYQEQDAYERSQSEQRRQIDDYMQSFSEIRGAAHDIAATMLTAFDPTRAHNFSEALREGLRAAVSVLFQQGVGRVAGGIGNLVAGAFSGPSPIAARGT